MPFLNSQGLIAHGVGSTGAFLDNTLIDQGGAACWFDPHTIAYQHIGDDGIYVALYDIHTRLRRRAVAAGQPFYNVGVNILAAGGGVWAGWLSSAGLFTSDGWALPAASVLAVGDAGEVAYIQDYQAGVPVVVRERTGDEWLLSPAAVLDADLFGGGRAVFSDYAATLHAVGLPPLVVIPGGAYRPRAVAINGQWWISYFSNPVGKVVLHPFDSTVGYLVNPQGGDCWQDLAALGGDVIGVAVATTAGEVAGTVALVTFQTTTDARQELNPEPEPEPEPEPAMKPPIVTVDFWNLDDVLDGREIVFRDEGNPELQIGARVWVQGGSMFASFTNKAGSAQTGAQRTVHPCSQGNPDPEPEPEPEPEPKPEKFTLRRHDVSQFVSVNSEAFLTQAAGGATFEEVPQADGTIGLQCNGKYVAAESDDRCKADRDSVGEWERWTKEVLCEDPPQVAYRSWARKYLSCHDDGQVRADQFAVGGWETLVQAAVRGPALHGRLRIDGRMLRDDIDYYRPVWSDALAILTRPQEAFLDWVVTTGFNGVRVFCGDLPWAPQTPSEALAALPGFLQLARARGLRVEVTALTGTESGYDPTSYIAEAAAICEPFDNAILELANEPWHPTQEGLTPDFLMSCEPCVPPIVISALGAAENDESSDYAGGPYITAHLDRSRDEWNMVRRVRELEALSVNNSKFVMNNEPIKAGSQNNNPSIFFTMAVLNRGFEVGGVFHSDDGLEGRVPAPGSEQQALAEAYIRGARVITTLQRMTYKNAGWHDSPIKSFSGAVRVYSFMADQNVSVALGIEAEGTEGPFAIETQNGWALGPILDEMPGVKVYSLVHP